MSRSIADALRDGAVRLAGIADDPRREARMLLAHALGVTAADLIRDAGKTVETAAYTALLARRGSHEPMALILGSRGFWTLDLEVSRATLIPRADSEAVVEAVLARRAQPPARILDLGTGTGCLLLALLREYPTAFGIGVDRVPAAVALAERNARRNGLSTQCGFVAANWSDPLDGRFDVIVSNPPYIPAGDIPGLMPEVAAWEPASALDGGPDGYDAYRTILARLDPLLAPGGLVALEVGAGQAADVASMARDAGFDADTTRDLGGIDRCIVLSAPLR